MRNLRIPFLFSAIALVLVNSPMAAAAGQHGGGHSSPAASLLPACQGAALPAPDCGRTPAAAFDGQGRLWLVFSQNGHLYLTHSADRGASFAAPMVVNRVPETISDDGENRPKLLLGDAGQVFLSWTVKTPGKYAGAVRFARSLDGGRHFDDPVTVNDDHAPISHRFDAMARDRRGRLYILWLDKRDLAAAKRNGSDYAGAAVYYAVSDDDGASFTANRKLVDHSCECCRIAVDIDDDDRLVALWRHVYPVNLRDHAIARVRADSPTLSGEPVRATDDGWIVDGCPHHGPDLSLSKADGQAGKAHITWFTRGTKHRGLMYGRFDLDQGQLELQQSIDEAPAASRPQVLATNGRVWRAWKAFDGSSTRLMAADSTDEGETWSAARVIAQTAAASDHPDLIAWHDEVFLSWHTQAEGYRLLPITGATP